MHLSFCLLLSVLVQFIHAPWTNAAADHARAPEAVQAGGYSPSLFNFVTQIQDDGTDQGGGWQVAATPLKFYDMRHLLPDVWTCTIRVGMPLRTKLRGVITPAAAATMSAAAATTSSVAVMHQRPKWIPAAYCNEFKAAMKANINASNPGLGANVERL